MLFKQDAGKSPHFSTSHTKVLNRFLAKIADQYQLNCSSPASTETGEAAETGESNPTHRFTLWGFSSQPKSEPSPLEETFQQLMDNLCEPWAHNDVMKSWQMHHIQPETLSSVDKAMLDLDDLSSHRCLESRYARPQLLAGSCHRSPHRRQVKLFSAPLSLKHHVSPPG